MKFNTAIFYDIENLIGGYGSGHMELLLNLSLKQINLLIQEKGYGKIAIRRGYADWSNTRLCQLKSDIVELGIEPRQLFGFGKGGLKNASDIYMVVDVMEVLFSKPEIEHFVIVSGDGGFSPLANKLHEYGKVVVGCAYRRQTNKLFEATTDEFIWLTDPLGTAEGDKIPEHQPFTNTCLIEYASIHRPVASWDKKIAMDIGKEIAAFMAASVSLERRLNKEGVNVSVFSELLRYRIPTWDCHRIGYRRSVEFIAEIIESSKLIMMLSSERDHRLVLPGVHPEGYLDYKVYMATHTVANYRKVLSEGLPAFRQFDLSELTTVSAFVCQHHADFQSVNLNTITEKLMNKMGQDSLSVMKSVTTLISANCFVKSDADAGNGQYDSLSFVPRTNTEVVEQVSAAMQQKLKKQVRTIDAVVMKNVFQ